MSKKAVSFVALVFWASLLAFPSLAERSALVIGNSSYRPGFELKNPVADARAIARRFSELGFSVTLVQDGDLATAQRALDRFVPAAIGAEVAVIFYAGHGATINGRSFALPVDFAMASFDDVDREALDTERLMQALSSTHAGLKILLFDACRNNPLESRGAMSLQQPAEEAPVRSENMLIAFSTAQGAVALDGAGDHSPFAQGVLGELGTPETDITDFMQRVATHVREQTDGRQTVWIEHSLSRSFSLASIGQPTGFIEAVTPPEPKRGTGEIFAMSSDVRLTAADLTGLDAGSLRLARNEIFARRGYIFRDQKLAEHFAQFDWYRPTTSEPRLGETELANVELIRAFELRGSAPTEGFVFTDSDRRRLEREEVAGLNAATLRLARNEIYARRGRKFVSQDLREYFSRFGWYRPQFGEVELTYVEQKNVDLIRRFE
ncbi:MAG: YARHG domain-containing protein [Rhizobiaceae bacterium]